MQQTFSPPSGGIPSSSFVNYDQSEIGKVFIRRVVFSYTRPFHDQYSRSYEAHLNASSVNSLARRIEQNGMSALTAASLAGTASNMISVSAIPSSNTPVAIPGGWQERRLVFFLDIETRDLSGATTIYYIQGYTDHCGISEQSHSVSPDMTFFINNVIVLRPTRNALSGVSSEHLLYDALQQNRYCGRPEDIYRTLESTSMANGGWSTNGSAAIYDIRAALDAVPKYSNRRNNIATNYASKLLHGMCMASEVVPVMATPVDVYGNASGYVGENDITLNPFIAALAKNRRSGMGTGVFTWKDLVKLRPDLANPNCPEVVLVTAGGATQVGGTAYWSEGTIEAKYAATLAQAIPSLMIECLLSDMVFQSTNQLASLGGNTGVLTMIQMSKALDGSNGIRQAEVFRNRLETEVLKDISYGNQQKFDISVSAKAFGTTFISISIDGAPRVDYEAPTFCDGIISPVLMQDYSEVTNLALGMENLLTTVSEAITNRENEERVYSPVHDTSALTAPAAPVAPIANTAVSDFF